ncbi:MAG: hypothetical protein WC272_11330 [Sulfurimonas sp.]
MGQFFLVAKIVTSHSRRSFLIYALAENGKRVYLGAVPRKTLSMLMQGYIEEADISIYAESKEQAKIPLNFSVELKQ